MKRYITIVLMTLLSLTLSLNTYAIVAYPKPFKVTQPDGSTITIKVHGDEFLNWTTCGDALVAKGDDGFYHLASFDANGASKVSGARITTTPSGEGKAVRPPKSALLRASQSRKAMKYEAARIRQVAAKNNAVTGEDHFLVMLVGFSDLPFSVKGANDAFTKLLNQEGYSEYGGTGSARDYYKDQSRGQFKPNFDVFGPYTVDNKMSTYSGEDGTTQSGAPKLLAEACKKADSEIDFSKYDHDGDGVIDNIFFYYAGYNSAYGNSGTIWPHAWAVQYGTFKFDGVQLFGYACSSELDGLKPDGKMASIGAFCHEFAHTIGLPDFYDTDYEKQGEGYGLGEYSLMSQGSYNNDEKTPPYFNCEERQLLGWMGSIPSVPQKSKTLILSPVQDNEGYTSPTNNEGEYFLYEYRNGTGWDAPLKPGLIIYHVDKSNNVVEGYTAAYRWKNWYGINDVASHECFKLMLANRVSDIVPFGGRYKKFSYLGSPSFQSWSGEDTGFSLTEITHNGETASFKSNCAIADLFSKEGICAIETGANLMAGDTFKFKLVEIENVPASVKWSYDGAETTSESVVLTAGEHTVKAEVSWTNGDSGSYTAAINVK